MHVYFVKCILKFEINETMIISWAKTIHKTTFRAELCILFIENKNSGNNFAYNIRSGTVKTLAPNKTRLTS